MDKIDLAPSRNSAMVRRLVTYTAGLLLCLKGYSNPVFATSKNIHSLIDYSYTKDPIVPKDSIYLFFYTKEDSIALKTKPEAASIEAFDKLIEKDKKTPMGYSFLQSRRYLWLGNRYKNIAGYAAATDAYMQGLTILDSIFDKLDPIKAREHRYRLSLALAETYSYQEGEYIHEKGINHTQDALNTADSLMKLNPNNGSYRHWYYNAISRKAALSVTKWDLATAYMLYMDLEQFYKTENNLYGLAVVEKSRADIEAKRDNIEEAIYLMEQADDYFQKYFAQEKKNPNEDYKKFLLKYAEYLIKAKQAKKAQEMYSKQQTIATNNPDIHLQELLVEWLIDLMNAKTEDEKLAALEKIKRYHKEQQELNDARAVAVEEIKRGVEKKEREAKEALERENTERLEKEKAQAQAQAAQKDKELALQRENTERLEKEKAQAQAQSENDRAEKEKAEKEVEKQRSKNALLGAAILALFAIGAVLFWLQKKKQNKEKEEQNKKLSEKNTIIEAANKELEQQKAVIEKQRAEGYDLLHQLEEALRAGWNIQWHHLDNAKIMLERHIPDHFVFYSPSKPKNKVSGDFYRSERKGSKTYLVTGDCTWHWVEWALTSTVMLVLLPQIIMHAENTDQSAWIIWDRLHKSVSGLNQKKEKLDGTKDPDMRGGMDGSLCIYDEDAKTLEFAWAKHPVYILRKKEKYNPEDVEQLEIKTDRKTGEIPQNDDYILLECETNSQAIWDDKEQNFFTYTVNLQPGDVIYTFSDGYQDQFGWPDGKKFMIKPLRELLLSVSWKPLQEQNAIIQDVFYKRKWNQKQFDDVLLIGIQVPETGTEKQEQA
jgi:serine phosphatase RsbU (regulator of sigma subunit)